MLRTPLLLILIGASAPCAAAAAGKLGTFDLHAIASPIIFQGNEQWAYRDPAAVFHNNTFFLYFTVSEMDGDSFYNRTGMSKSRDLVHWTQPRFLTPRDRTLNYSSPGNVIRFGGQWVLCLQTYPTPRAGQSTGDSTARIWIMRSDNLEDWSEPELLRVKGPEVAVKDMGRMIDPFLIEDAGDPGKWWCFYKQDGVSMSWSRDLKTWAYVGRRPAGENVTILRRQDDYLMLHSPANGIGIKTSQRLDGWADEGSCVYLGQRDWPWAQARLTAATAVDLTKDARFGVYIVFFHGARRSKGVPATHGCASLALAWTPDFVNWGWPGKSTDQVVAGPPDTGR